MRKFLICLLSCLTVFASLAFVGCNVEFTVTFDGEFAVTFDGDGGTLVSGKEVQTVTSASQIKPPNYEKEGYEFDGWSVLLDGIKEDTTIKAKWKEAKYTVTFDGDGGTLVSGKESQTVQFASEINAPVYNKAGYNFNGWDKDFSIIKENLTVKALWEAAKYTLSFDLNGGSGEVPAEMEVPYYGTLGDLPVPTRGGYVFAGWKVQSEAGEPLDSGMKWTFANDIVAVAVWEEGEGYTITYDFAGGVYSGEKVTVYREGDVVDLSKIIPSKKCYEFLGWAIQGSSEIITEIKNRTGAVTVVAQWKLTSYSVVFSNAPRNNTKPDRTVIIGDEYKDVFIGIGETLGDKLPAGVVFNPEEYGFKKWVVYINGKTIEIKKDTVFNEELFEGAIGTEITIYPELQGLWIGPY